MTKARPYTLQEREIIEEGAASGMLARQIVEALAARGFTRGIRTIRGGNPYLQGRVRRAMEAKPEPVETPPPMVPDRSVVVYEDLVIRRVSQTRMAFHKRTGEAYPVTISLPAGVSFQVSA